MLRIVKTQSGDAPQFFCDHCKASISDAGLALYIWKEYDSFRWGKDDENDPEFVIPPTHPSLLVENGLIYTLHKSCVDEFEIQNSGKSPGGKPYRWPWMEFIDLLVFLIHNSGSSVEKIQERIEHRKEMFDS